MKAKFLFLPGNEINHFAKGEIRRTPFKGNKKIKQL
jgi:hypothetical protein